jgi:RNase H-fold protein (predicted Holliday junction resolvase)
MNERIKELERQAEKFVMGIPASLDINEYTSVFNEKFAELIVEECMWKIMTRKEEAIDNNWRVDEAMSAAISDISEHFGVEE